MRRFLILSLSAIFSITAAAAPGTVKSQTQIADFVKKTKLNQKSRSFAELLEASRASLASDDYARLKDFSREVPGLMIPKVQINKIKNDRGGEDMQIQMVQDGQSSTIDVTQTSKDEVTLKFSSAFNKKAKTVKFSTKDSESVIHEQLLSLMQEAGAYELGVRRSGFQLLGYEDLQKLNKNELKEYFFAMQDMLASAEQVQNAGVGRLKTSSFFEMLLDSAHASNARARTGACIVAGYASEYKGGVCGKDDANVESRTAGDGTPEVKCNPSIYGSGEPAWVKRSGNSTDACNKARDEYSGFPQSIPNKEKFEELKRDILTALENANSVCQTLTASGANPGADQVDACKKLRERYVKVSRIECQQLQKGNLQGRFRINCGANPADQVAVPQTPAPPAAGPECGSMGCPRDQLSCPENQREAVSQCPGHYRCRCNPQTEQPVMNGTQYETACSPLPSPPRQEGRPERRQEGHSTGMLLAVGLGGAALGALVTYFLMKDRKKIVHVPVEKIIEVEKKIYVPYTPAVK